MPYTGVRPMTFLIMPPPSSGANSDWAQTGQQCGPTVSATLAYERLENVVYEVDEINPFHSPVINFILNSSHMDKHEMLTRLHSFTKCMKQMYGNWI